MAPSERELAEAFARDTAAQPEDLDQHWVLLSAELNRPRRALWAGLAAVGALAAAVLLFVLAQPGPLPVPLELALDGGGGERIEPVPGLALELDGSGQLGGSDRRPELSWSRGKVRVEVEPGSLDGFSVHTREGAVRVVGTVFSVERDALGVEVAVERGEVELTCVDAEPAPLRAGESARCLPTTAAGMLARARALEGAGEPLARVQEALAAGLALSPGAALSEELMLRNAVALDSLGQEEAAWAQVLQGIATAQGPRRPELLRVGLDLAVRQGECGVAQELADELGLGGGQPPVLGDCAQR